MKGHFQLVCQVYNIARLLGPFCFLSRFLWETKSPFFPRDFQNLLRHHYCNISPITGELWYPFWKPYFVWKSHLNKDDDDDYYNQTAVKRQSKTSCLFTAKSTRNKGIEELSITAKKEARKTTNRQIRDPIAVSYFFLACVAWRFWLGALSNKGGRGQRNREEIGAEATWKTACTDGGLFWVGPHAPAYG